MPTVQLHKCTWKDNGEKKSAFFNARVFTHGSNGMAQLVVDAVDYQGEEEVGDVRQGHGVAWNDHGQHGCVAARC